MFLFERERKNRWRIRITGDTVPTIGVIFIGRTLEMQRAIYGGHSPITLSRVTKRTPVNSESGNNLGLSVVRRGVSTSFSWNNLTAQWYRNNFDPFVRYATQSAGTFFIAWRPSKYPNEVGYCWVDANDITPSNNGTRNLMDVTMPVKGHVDKPQDLETERFA